MSGNMHHSENIKPHGSANANKLTSSSSLNSNPSIFPANLPQTSTNESTNTNLPTNSSMNPKFSSPSSVYPQPSQFPKGAQPPPNYVFAAIPTEAISENSQTFNSQHPFVIMQPLNVPVSQPQGNTGMQPPKTYGAKHEHLEAINWMSKTHIPLKDLRILGSNNSGFFMGEERTQRVDIAEQLKIGIRFFDLMIVQYEDEIYIDQYKHIYELCCPYITICETLLSIRLFLKRYPNEVIFISLRCKHPNDANKNIEEEPSVIDAELLEAKFDVIKDIILNVNEINFDMTAKDLTASTKKNIICFTSTSGCFKFLLENKLSLNGYQLEVTTIIEYDIPMLLHDFWSKQKSITPSSDPYKHRYSWLVIDAVTAECDAKVLKETWEIYNSQGTHVPFYFFSLCKVTKKTWKDFIELMLSVQGAQQGIY